MKDNLLLVSLLHPRLKVADVRFNCESILSLLEKAERRAAVLLFPELTLTGYTAQDLFFQHQLIDDTLTGILTIKEKSKDIPGLIVFGAPLAKNNSLYNCAIYVQKGKILGVVPKSYIPNYGEFYEARWFASGKDIRNQMISILNEEVPFGTDLLLEDTASDAVIGAEICEDLWVMEKPSTHMAMAGANLILNLSASDETIGKAEYRRNLVALQSATTYSAYCYCSSSSEESSQDLVFSGHTIIAANGTILKESIYPEAESILSAVIDLDQILYNRIHQSTFTNDHETEVRRIKVTLPCASDKETIEEKAKELSDLSFAPSPYPFVPNKENERKERCLEILRIQAHGLATRVKNTGIFKLVLGISGGLDSTLALLVACEAKKIAPEIQIIGITMPSKGNTSSLTYQNAKSLLSLLCDETREIAIQDAVTLHLKDLGRPGYYLGEKDVTYENAQARYRTYLLMDIANQIGGLVVGTGDLSELALGWCTYNGDHMSMYGINASIPKTLVRHLVKTYAEELGDEKLRATLESILATPISPELTPNKEGKIQQKTEDRIGKYDLNDFFLFYVLRYGTAPEKILLFALLAYPSLSKEEIKNALIRFYQRFYSQQFKRSCLPDSVKVGSVSLSPRGDFRMASDLSASSIIETIKKL